MTVQLKKYYENIELTIWLALIPRMKENHPLGMAIRSVYGLFWNRSVEKGMVLSLVSVLLGLMAGILLALVRWISQ